MRLNILPEDEYVKRIQRKNYHDVGDIAIYTRGSNTWS